MLVPYEYNKPRSIIQGRYRKSSFVIRCSMQFALRVNFSASIGLSRNKRSSTLRNLFLPLNRNIRLRDVVNVVQIVMNVKLTLHGYVGVIKFRDE